MGGVSTPEGKGGDVELNLVPFIDLLSALVLFLLLGAVWVQVAAINTSVNTKGGSAAQTSQTVQKRLNVHLSKTGYTLDWPRSAPKALPKAIGLKEGGYDTEGLKAIIESIAADGVIDSGAISAEEAIEYGHLILALDSIKAAGVHSVALNTN